MWMKILKEKLHEETNSGEGEGNTGAGGNNEGDTQDWRSALPEDIREAESLKNFEDVGQLAKSFVETKAMQGNSIRIPGEDAGDEDKKEFVDKLLNHVPDVMLKPNFEDDEQSTEFFRSIGMPEKPEEYEIPEVEGVKVNEDRANVLQGLAHKHKITKSQFAGFMKDLNAIDAQVMQQRKEQAEENQKALAQEWGVKYDANISAAAKIAELTGAPSSLLEAVKNKEAGPETMKWLLELSQAIGGEGSAFNDQQGGGNASGMTPAEADAKISEIMNNKKHPYWDSHHPEHGKALQNMIKLQAYKDGRKPPDSPFIS